jgi:hypothetical protein
MTIQPKGEDLRKAVKWVSQEHKYNKGKKLKALIEEACLKFNLSPMDADFLTRTLREQEK